MKKTVTINLAGSVFHIDEDAYDQLKQYMESVKGHFSEADEQDEIITDIELRITELLQEKKISIISIQDVADVIKVLGTPEDYIDEPEGGSEPGSSKEEEDPAWKQAIKKRIFRNPDERILGGVCGGLGSYFDMDPFWVRLAFVLGMMVGGTGIIVYLLLWLIIPQPSSTADKLKMRGEPITAETIGKAVIVEKMDSIKTSLETVEPKKMVSILQKGAGGLFAGLGKLWNLVRGGLRRILGVILLFIGTGLTLALALLFLNIFGDTGFFNFGNKAEFSYVLESIANSLPGGLLWLMAGAVLLIGIPIIQIIYIALRLLFRLNPQPNFLKAVFTLSWIVGLLIVILFGAFSFAQFGVHGYHKRQVVLEEVLSDTLAILLRDNAPLSNGRHGFPLLYDEELAIMYSSEVRLNIESSADKNFHLIVEHEARGASRKEAAFLAGNIGYNYIPDRDRIHLNGYLKIRDGDPYRFQESDLTILVPQGKSVYLDKSVKYFLYDVDNITNTRDRAMVNHTWKMTPTGLACTDCN